MAEPSVDPALPSDLKATLLQTRAWELEQQLAWWKEHTDSIDRNWEANLNACIQAIQSALDMPDASIPDMIAEIARLRQLDPPRGSCGMPFHLDGCPCDGAGGSR